MENLVAGHFGSSKNIAKIVRDFDGSCPDSTAEGTVAIRIGENET